MEWFLLKFSIVSFANPGSSQFEISKHIYSVWGYTFYLCNVSKNRGILICGRSVVHEEFPYWKSTFYKRYVCALVCNFRVYQFDGDLVWIVSFVIIGPMILDEMNFRLPQLVSFYLLKKVPHNRTKNTETRENDNLNV